MSSRHFLFATVLLASTFGGRSAAAYPERDIWLTPGPHHVPTMLAELRFHDLVKSGPLLVVVGTGNSGAQYQNTRHNMGRMFVNAVNQNATATTRQSELETQVMNGFEDPGVAAPVDDDTFLHAFAQTYDEPTRITFDDDTTISEVVKYRTEPVTYRTARGEVYFAKRGHVHILYVVPFHDINESGVFVASVVNYLNEVQHDLVTADNLYVAIDDLDFPLGKFKFANKSGAGHGANKSLLEHLPDDLHRFNRLRLGIGRPANGTSIIDHVLGEWTADEQVAATRVLNEATTAFYEQIAECARIFSKVKSKVKPSQP